jgi:hypothetical protein
MTRLEINTRIEAMRRIIDNPSTPQNIKDNAQSKLDELMDMIPSDESGSTEPTPEPKERKPRAKKQEAESDSGVLNAMLSTLRTMMLSNEGSGVDSSEVRKIIEDFLVRRKISLNELDKSVLDEIKKNQTVVLTLPNYDLQIVMDKSTTNIPNIFSILDDVLAGNNVYLIGEAGGGKAQPLSAKILTPKGWITFADVKEGDDVIGQDGKVYKVDGVFDRGVKDVYQVVTSDGGVTECCDEHLWEIQTRLDRNKKRGGRVVPLSDFKDNLSVRGASNVYIPVAQGINFEAKSHVIDPYILGVILGDGNITTNAIKITNPDEGVFNEVKKLLPENINVSIHNTQDKTFTYALTQNGNGNEFVSELRKLDLLYKKSIDKHIPKEYLFDSYENRVSLLQGLCDTDGFSDNSHFEFSTSSEKLSIDFAELVRSLGGVCKTTSRMGKYKTKEGKTKETHISFRLSCVFPDGLNPFRASAKTYIHNQKYKVKKQIVEVKYKGKEEVRCISVTNPRHLYITDDYIVTHNTYTAEKVAEILNRDFMVLNCSQYTSPVEIIGGQTIDGYKDGKLVISWRDGKLLILDEMPKLDPNTAGLLNDALAKSSKTRANAYINSANPSEPPIPRSQTFAVIGTGNVYPNKPNPAGYVGNNQQDLSLLDRFSGSVYFVDYSEAIDQDACRYQFLYDMLVGNYHEWVIAKREGRPTPKPRGLRTVVEATNMKNLALVSYRTITAFRVAFEIELVRAIARSKGEDVTSEGKTVLKAYESYLVAFPDASKETLIRDSGYTLEEVNRLAKDTVNAIINGGEQGFMNSLTRDVRANAAPIYEESLNFLIAEKFITK